MIIKILLLCWILNIQQDDIKPCEKYCCQNIACAVTRDDLGVTKHGLDCPILAGCKLKRVRYVIGENFDFSDVIVCAFCHGEKMNYDRTCQNHCCKHVKYIINMEDGLLHSLDCKDLKHVDITMCLIKMDNYNVLKRRGGGGIMDYISIHHCLPVYGRLN